MQRSEFPLHRSVCEGYLTVKNVPGAPISKGPRDSLSLFLPPLFSFSLSNGVRPFRYRREHSLPHSREKYSHSCRYTLVQLRGYLGPPPPRFTGVFTPRSIGWVSKRGESLKTRNRRTTVAHDTRFYARTRFVYTTAYYTYTRPFALQLVGGGGGWEVGEKRALQAKWNIFTFTGGDTGGFAALRQTRPVETPRVRLMYRPVTIINVLSTSCYDKLPRWTDMGSFKYTAMLFERAGFPHSKANIFQMTRIISIAALFGISNFAAK